MSKENMTKETPERRFREELRLDFQKSGPKLTGYAAVFNQETELWPGFREKVAPGAFTESLKTDDIRALFNHDPSALLGRNKSGTLKLWEDERGLAYEISIPDTDDGKKVINLIKRGDLSASSFGFNILKRSVEMDEEKDEMTRTLERVQLFDVSPVTYPAYPQTEGLTVRMERLDKECQYLVGDRVIESIPLEKREEKDEGQEEKSSKEFLEEVDAFLEKSEP